MICLFSELIEFWRRDAGPSLAIRHIDHRPGDNRCALPAKHILDSAVAFLVAAIDVDRAAILAAAARNTPAAGLAG
jgi:hypothetical protein